MLRGLCNMLLWPLWGLFTRRFRAIGGGEDVIIVLGMPRSGTSIASRLVQACGVYFGEEAWMRPADSRNEDGFLELHEINQLDDRLVEESGFKTHLFAEPWLGLRAVPGMRLRRLVTRYRMQRILSALTQKQPWGLKQTPFTFYWWRQYVPKARIIAIYREPRSCADSIHRTFNRFTFGQALEWWTRGNTELLYHLSRNESLLIKLEDLLDQNTQDRVLKKIADFCGGAADELTQALPLNTRPPKQSSLMHIPLPAQTQAVYEALEAFKRR